MAIVLAGGHISQSFFLFPNGQQDGSWQWHNDQEDKLVRPMLSNRPLFRSLLSRRTQHIAKLI